MDAGSPDPLPIAPPPPSLVEQVRHRLARRRAGSRQGESDWRVGSAVAILLAAGPVLTIAGAHILARSERRETETLRAEVQPRLDARRARDQAREWLRTATSLPSVGATLDALARSLPPDDRLLRVERSGAGGLELEVVTADPDRLLSALRRTPSLAGLRSVAQHRADAAMIVTLRDAAS